MFLRAGAISLGLLLASRLLGLLRETVQAAAFGASGLADVVVLMLTIPDWITGVLVSGALAYVLLPHWARQSHPAQMALQRRVARVLVVAGLGLGLLLAFFPGGLMVLLAPGLPASLAQVSRQAVWWSAAALAPALLATLWATRLQHLRDFLGLYAANLVFTGVVTLALAVAALAVLPAGGLQGLGPALLGAALLRLAWLAWRMHMAREGSTAGASEPAAQAGADAAPGVRVWLWASLAAGLPLVLPFAARSLASAGGAGQLATFNYAWKLVELPLLLAIQLVATLTLPVVARTLADGRDPAPALRRAFALAWVLACAAIAGLLAGAPAVAQLLFGWGRMTPHDVQRMAQWGLAGAWGLLPQALLAVAMTVLAARGRMGPVVVAHGLALATLLAWGIGAGGDGTRLMWALNAASALVALVALASLGREALAWLPWPAMAASAAALAGTAALTRLMPVYMNNMPLALAIAGLAAIITIAFGWLAGSDFRAALQRQDDPKQHD
jgi:putative peptidoglycan lipid II flippase